MKLETFEEYDIRQEQQAYEEAMFEKYPVLLDCEEEDPTEAELMANVENLAEIYSDYFD